MVISQNNNNGNWLQKLDIILCISILAVGYTLDEIPNDITKKTPASFEPTIDYVVTKIPALPSRSFLRLNPYLLPNWHPPSVGDAGGCQAGGCQEGRPNVIDWMLSKKEA